MLSKKQISARIYAKRIFKEYRDVVRAHPPAYMCVCFDGNHLVWCDEHEGRRPCVHKCDEVTELFDRWLDGEINRSQLVKALYDMHN